MNPGRELNKAMALANQGQLDMAEAVCRQALATHPKSVDLQHFLAVLLCKGGRLTEGETLLRQILAAHPENVQALAHLGDALHAQNRIGESIAVFRELTARTPKDPIAHMALGISLLAAGHGEDAAAEFRQAVAHNPEIPMGFFNLATTLHRLGRLNEAVSAYLRAIANDPGHAEAYLCLGNALADAGRNVDALATYEHAIQVIPEWPAALANAGLVRKNMGQLEEAAALERRALAKQPDHADAWTNLGAILQAQGQLDEAIDAYRHAVALRPEHGLTLSNLAQALQGRGDQEESMQYHRKAIAVAPDVPLVHFNLALALLQGGEYAEGWREYEWRWRGGVQKLKPRGFSQPQWQGEALDGKTLLLHGEQGVGDTFQFIRFLPDVLERGARVVLEAQAPAVPLLRMLPGISSVFVRGQLLPSFDVHLPLMSLPHVLGLTDCASLAPRVPAYLPNDPARTANWSERMGPRDGRLRVGVTWAGNPSHVADRLRSIPASLIWDKLAALSDRVQFFSLQKDIRQEDRDVLARHADTVRNLGEDFDSFADTAAVVTQLDLVLAVDTAVAHLTGGLGRPVWVLLPYLGDWRWGQRHRADTPWYSTMRLFHQTCPCDWAEVLDRVITDMTSLT